MASPTGIGDARVPPEVMWGRRAFPKSQELLSALGVAGQRLPARVGVGWHDTSVDPERGAFAVFGNDSGLDDLLGEVIRVSRGEKAVFVYVLGARATPTPLSLTRRAFMALGSLGLDSLSCVVEVVA